MVCPDPESNIPLLAKLHQGGEPLPDPLQLVGILGVAVVADVELLRVGKIPRIDPNLLNPLRGLECGLGLEVDVGDQRNRAPDGIQPEADVPEVGGVLHRRCGDPHHLAPDLD